MRVIKITIILIVNATKIIVSISLNLKAIKSDISDTSAIEANPIGSEGIKNSLSCYSASGLHRKIDDFANHQKSAQDALSIHPCTPKGLIFDQEPMTFGIPFCIDVAIFFENTEKKKLF